MRTAWASSLRRLGASLLAVMLCAVLVQPAQAITSNSHFTPAIPVTEKTAYTGVLVVVVEPCTGLFGEDNPVDMTDPSGNDGDLGSLAVAGGISGTIDGLSTAATVGAEASAETSIAGAVATTEAEATVATETAAAASAEAGEGSEFIETAKATLRTLGKSVRGLIEQAKKLMKLAKDSPIKVIPMPRSVIPDITKNIATYQITHLTSRQLTRCSALEADENRAESLRGLAAAGPGLSLDEYPFASSTAGGAGAQVMRVPFWQNCVQGGIIASCYRIEGINVGTPYFVVITP